MTNIKMAPTKHTEAPLTLSAEAYISENFARDEKDLMWKRVWQVACREEEIPNIGNYCTYEIHDQSIIVVRIAEDKIAAYRNACLHRGRTLTEGCGRTARFHCKYHGWQWALDGEIAHVHERESWDGSLNDTNLRLPQVNVGTWGGFVFVNLNTDCEPLETYLKEVIYYLDQFDIHKMRYTWRKWTRVNCNWKVAIEAFNEGYHANTTHPMLNHWGTPKIWSKAQGIHGNIGQEAGGGIGTGINSKEGMPPREVIRGAVKQQMEVCNANTTETFIQAAEQVYRELPDTATAEEVGLKLMEFAYIIDAGRGVEWPSIDLERYMEAGINWNVFPNTIILPNVTYCLGFRARPDGLNPDSCIFEVFNLERFPEGEIPKVENEYIEDHKDPRWGLLLQQDFSNMPFVQKGMKADGLKLTPNPYGEETVINFRRALASYMGYGGPESR
jgi:phenylpropionate dioxygenase-like ring-hydroxylating dioxygenase large terminal subunit